jgi:hypothetical protein
MPKSCSTPAQKLWLGQRCTFFGSPRHIDVCPLPGADVEQQNFVSRPPHDLYTLPAAGHSPEEKTEFAKLKVRT